MSEIVLVLTTWPDQQMAQKVARQWLEARLVACVNILPRMTSMYLWDGELQTGTEHQLLLKTSAAKVDELERTIAEQHPYECPEILRLEVSGGHDEYLTWIKGNTE